MMLVYPGIGLGCIERMNYIYRARPAINTGYDSWSETLKYRTPTDYYISPIKISHSIEHLNKPLRGVSVECCTTAFDVAGRGAPHFGCVDTLSSRLSHFNVHSEHLRLLFPICIHFAWPEGRINPFDIETNHEGVAVTVTAKVWRERGLLRLVSVSPTIPDKGERGRGIEEEEQSD